MTAKTEKAPNYTVEQEQAIRDAAPVTAAIAENLAATLGKTVASIRAKAVRLGVYESKPKTDKAGRDVITKEVLAGEIADLVGVTAEGLEKAPKESLRAIRDALTVAVALAEAA